MRHFFLASLLTFPIAAPAGSLTISGISSGGFMASQMATIYSDQYSGVATVAGGVFYCAENKFQENLRVYGNPGFFHFGMNTGVVWKKMGLTPDAPTSNQSLVSLPTNPIHQSVGICMGLPEGAHQIDMLVDGKPRPMNLQFLADFEANGLIAPTENIAKQRVLIFQGENDQVVKAPMAAKLQEFYSRLGVPDSKLKVVMGKGNHNFPTSRKDGIDCKETRPPYIASCDHDLAGDILKHVLGRNLSKAKFNIQHLRKIHQRNAPKSLAKYGYIYATPYCLNNPEACDLHVALHGCQMSDDFDQNFQSLYQSKVQLTRRLGIRDYELKARKPKMGALSFARRAGYAEYAEDVSNRLMILFPQVQINTANYPSNPNGCWDWYGWTGSDYATNKGSETSWLNAYVNLVKSNPRSLFMSEITKEEIGEDPQ